MKKGLLLIALYVLFGFTEVDAKQLIPMGMSVGVKLELDHHLVSTDLELNENLTIHEGTIIKKVNGNPVTSKNDLLSKIAKTNHVEGLYEGKKFTAQLNKKQMGELIATLKYETEGVGTLTYIDPETLEFGAIGHQIPNHSNSESDKFKHGYLYPVRSESIYKSSPGKPGFKVAQILDTQPLGEVKNNHAYGVFGKWQPSSTESLPEPIEIMQNNELRLGPATMLYAVNDGDVKAYAIEITKLDKHQFQFTIKDKNLLSQTGGIVQGMSGSPILQDGQFVGAITHMFIEKPANGVGLMILEMLEKR